MNRLALAILLNDYLGIPYVLYGEWEDAPDRPWYWLKIRLGVSQVEELMNLCAEVGARKDLLFLKGKLEEFYDLTSRRGEISQ